MTDQIHLEVIQETIDGKSRRITRLREDDRAASVEVFHQFDRLIPWSDESLLDGHVLAVLLHAASRGKPFRVHGPLSHSMMRNLEELQLAWSCCKPERYKRIEIIPDRIVDARRVVANESAIAAFSGGVDATFTAIHNAKILPETLRYPMSDVLMVHGFDVRIQNTPAFEQLVTRVRPLLDELQLHLRLIQTNSRELRQEWEDSFGLQLGGCLHMLSDDFQLGLVNSGEPYGMIEFPWGSTPSTDHLMSGDRMSIVHYGAGFSRTEKVDEIASMPTACKTLKVCWTGADQSTNCGHCEKCIRTRLNFLAAGVPSPACFPGDLEISGIKTIPVYNKLQMVELQSILDYATAHGVKGDWVPVLQRRIAKGLTVQRSGLPKKVLLSMLDAVGLKEPLKRLRALGKRR
jgi:hypothetical protein